MIHVKGFLHPMCNFLFLPQSKLFALKIMQAMRSMRTRNIFKNSRLVAHLGCGEGECVNGTILAKRWGMK